tara:strand:+ start:322 stop:990 length:669 start_codon:yes stop_codon:yes gene_type:complete
MKKYKSIIFDCDGVILNSNKVKTNAFRQVFEKYNINAVDEFIKYHRSNGGVSRYIKIEKFLKNILPKYYENKSFNEDELNMLLQRFSNQCKESLLKCEVTKDLSILRKITGNIPWLIISGGDQFELREIFNKRGLTSFFNGGIFGSPEKKTEIIKREIANGIIQFPALMLGDSKLDHIAAKSNNIDFLFVYRWTDFKSYNDYCIHNSIKAIESVSDIKEFFK